MQSVEEKLTDPNNMGPPMSTATSSGATMDIKSTAVVQYSSVKFPVQFSRISLNTDLNYPPSDRNRARYYVFPEHNEANQFSQFLSLNMANAYQDSVGQVDVISSSKNIKDLLKMPYSQSPHISIMVHRLRKTLLLEEFDVHKNLLKRHAEEWNWLRTYYNDVIAKEQENKTKCLVSANKRRDSFTENMYEMNLIRHSLLASIGDEQCTALETAGDRSREVGAIPEFSEDRKGFHHQTLWKFEDISMLIDSDLPIFGSKESRRPCISLRLRDASSPPINILTGLDYWLDNLMSNVPEVAMCYHVKGFVQKYEVLRTEDIPNLENSSFDPNEVLDIAQNIMSFIKRNAAVEGHTYWLYKSENDDMVKLYDLTEYCKNEIAEGDNPFTVPVGLLCHRVGRNLKRSGQRRTADARAMLENCLRLLDERKHAQVCADAHLLLCDMWVPDKSVNDIWQEKGKISETPSDLYDEDETGSDDNPVSEQHSQENIDPNEDDGGDIKALRHEEGSSHYKKMQEADEAKTSVALQELVVRGLIKRKAWDVVHSCRIAGTTDERCRQALAHIRKGLNCVDKDQARGKNIGLVERQQTCSPSKAIPLHYAPLNKNGGEKMSKDVSAGVEDVLQECCPFTPIPLPYTPLSTKGESLVDGEQMPDRSESISSKKASDDTTDKSESSSNTTSEASSGGYRSESNSGPFSSTSTEESSSESWHVEAKFQLLRKAAITYFVLAKEFFEIKKYGHTLRHLRYAMHCYEALELLRPQSVKEDSQELYLMLLYLAAQTRCCMPSNWHSCHRDYEELGEEEAAILHSAQSLLTTPKNSWMYEWPNNQESNLLAANELYEQAYKLPMVEKKPQSFRMLMKKNHAACVMSLSNTQMEICKEKVVKNNDTFEAVKYVWERSMNNGQRAMKMFEAGGDKNTSGHICSNIAYLHILAAAALHNHAHTDQVFAPKEKEHLFEAIEWYEKGLGRYERGEKMDEAREALYNNIRVQCHQMAQRYFSIPSGKVTEQDLRCMKELLQKSLANCFLDTEGKHLKSSQTTAAVNHLNLARVYDVETTNCTNASRKKQLRQKMEENFQKAFALYAKLKWRRSQLCAKFLWMNTLLEETETKPLSNQAKKKVVRSVFSHLCDLHPVLLALEEGDFDVEDNISIYTTNFSAVKQLLSVLNAGFASFLRNDKSNNSIKQLYQCSLRLTTITELSDLLSPLAAVLSDLKLWMASDTSH